jgi:hypothetical protein
MSEPPHPDDAAVLFAGDDGVRPLEGPAPGLSAAKLTAFLETRYLVHGPPELRLVVGELCAGLAQLHLRHGASSSVFVTAWNPGGEAASPEANARRQAELEAELDERGLTWLPGAGAHPTNDWPPEASALVLDLDLSEAIALGRRFGQAAVVWSGEDARARLVVLG